MRTVYGPRESQIWFRKMVRNFLVGMLIAWITIWITIDWPAPFWCCFSSSVLGFTVGFLVFVLIMKRRKEGRERELSVVVDDRGVIARGRCLLWEEITELREDPWEGYQLMFSPSKDEKESLQYINLDDFYHFDHFVEQLRNHGVKISIRRRWIR